MVINIKKYFARKEIVTEYIKKIELSGHKYTSKHTKRLEIAARRKSYFLLMLLIIISWSWLIYIIIQLDPMKPFSILIFFTTGFLCIYFTWYLIFFNKKKSFLIATAITFFVYLRFIGLGNMKSALIIIAVTFAYDRLVLRRV